MKKNKKINIGFIINYRLNGWIGVTNYYTNLFKILNIYKNKYKIVIITDFNMTKKEEENFKDFKIIKSKLFDRKNKLLKILNLIRIIFLKKNKNIENFLIENNISIISHTNYLGKKSSIPSIKWFPDFQEIEFPENFSFRQKIARKIDIILSSINSSIILLSSKSVRNDLKKINEKAYFHSKVVSHCTFIDIRKLKTKNYLKNKYKVKLNENFIFIPNHHWKHKNHITVYKSMKTLREKYKKNIFLITTGNKSDYRFPEHSNFLKNYIKKNDLSKNIINLGLIEYIDVLSFMKHCAVLINPSLSEGWGNMIDHANYFKKPIFLSDINVHKEQKPTNAIFFKKKSANDLSKKLYSFFYKKDIINNFSYENTDTKIYSFYKNYISLIDNVLKK